MTLTVWSFTDAARRAPTGTCAVDANRATITCGDWGLFVDPRRALMSPSGGHVTRLPCRVIGRDDQGELHCAPGKPTLDYDATEVLRSFARKEALGVMHLWNAPPVVKRYLRTGDPKLREAAKAATRVAARATTDGGAWAAAWSASEATNEVATGIAAASRTRATTRAAARAATWTAAGAVARPGVAAWDVAWAAAEARQSRRLARMLQAGAPKARVQIRVKSTGA